MPRSRLNPEQVETVKGMANDMLKPTRPAKRTKTKFRQSKGRIRRAGV
jgi:hypothetical protein